MRQEAGAQSGITINSNKEPQMIERTDHCLCGAAKFRITGEPIAARICWCRDCQYIAANGMVNAMVPTSALEISGNLSEYTSTADSGKHHTVTASQSIN
jgi:hypothetical protein